jgi:signal transduction histidine kinase
MKAMQEMQEFKSLDVLVLNHPEIIIAALIEKMIDQKEWNNVPAVALLRVSEEILNNIESENKYESITLQYFC